MCGVAHLRGSEHEHIVFLRCPTEANDSIWSWFKNKRNETLLVAGEEGDIHPYPKFRLLNLPTADEFQGLVFRLTNPTRSNLKSSRIVLKTMYIAGRSNVLITASIHPYLDLNRRGSPTKSMATISDKVSAYSLNMQHLQSLSSERCWMLSLFELCLTRHELNSIFGHPNLLHPE
jgi:hypothetical protein